MQLFKDGSTRIFFMLKLALLCKKLAEMSISGSLILCVPVKNTS